MQSQIGCASAVRTLHRVDQIECFPSSHPSPFWATALAEAIDRRVAAVFHYQLFGLRIRSEVELPELQTIDVADRYDVDIYVGPVTAGIEDGADYHVSEEGAGFTVAGVGRYWIKGGAQIIVEPDACAEPRNLRLYILGSAMGALLHQRGLLPLHANAIEIQGQAFAFMGRSGAGKSTLAAAFHDRGFRVIADDVAVIGFDSDRGPLMMPGIPRLRLSEDALHASGRDARDYEPSFSGDESFRKFDVPVPPGGASLPLAAVYSLDFGNELKIRRLEGADAAETIFANTYRGAFVRTGGKPVKHWQSAVQILGSSGIFELVRRKDYKRFDEDLDSVILHATQIARSRG